MQKPPLTSNRALTRKIIISIDVVVNKQNYKHVEDIMNMMAEYGIFEFDLLHIMPFGASLGNKHALFYSYEEAAPWLDKVFNYEKHPQFVVKPARHLYSQGWSLFVQCPLDTFEL